MGLALYGFTVYGLSVPGIGITGLRVKDCTNVPSIPRNVPKITAGRI